MTDLAPPAHTPLPYEEVTADTYAQTFAASYTAIAIRRGVLLKGACPRCGDQMQFPVITEIFQNAIAADRGAVQAASEEKPLLCTCQTTHPNRPAGEEGCGAYWNRRLTRPAS
jgi:hypothetical protein